MLSPMELQFMRVSWEAPEKMTCASKDLNEAGDQVDTVRRLYLSGIRGH